MASLSPVYQAPKVASAPVGIQDPREKDLQTQFGLMRQSMGAQKDESQRQADIVQKQAEARSGGFGGAGLKMAQKVRQDVDTAYLQKGNELGATEAQAKQELRSLQSTEKLQQQQLDTQKRAQDFAEWYGQMELDENKKTNYINAAIAAEKAGFDDKTNFNEIQQYFLNNVYPKGRTARPFVQRPA
jgi:hypothetical protein